MHCKRNCSFLLQSADRLFPSRVPTDGEDAYEPMPSMSVDSPNHLVPPPPPPPIASGEAGQRNNWRRRLSIRPGSAGGGAGGAGGGGGASGVGVGMGLGAGGGGVARRRRPSVSPGQAQVQLISIPQLDAIQRTLKLLDVRLQHVQSNAKDEERTRDDIDHIRRLMSENQKALTTVITVLTSMQEEVRNVSITMHKQQMNTFQLAPPPPRKKSSERSLDRDRSGSSREHSVEVSQI